MTKALLAAHSSTFYRLNLPSENVLVKQQMCYSQLKVFFIPMIILHTSIITIDIFNKRHGNFGEALEIYSVPFYGDLIHIHDTHECPVLHNT